MAANIFIITVLVLYLSVTYTFATVELHDRLEEQKETSLRLRQHKRKVTLVRLTTPKE